MTTQPRTPVDDRDARLLRVIDERFARAAARAGGRLACAPGCDVCCHGPFPITRLDHRRLQRGMAELAASDPSRARSVRRRARAAIERLADRFPGDPGSGRLRPDQAELDRFFAGHRRLACPALDPGSGRCELYRWRPVSCRTYGPPQRFRGVDSAPCDLCFVGASQGEVEACRYEPDPAGLEESLLLRMGAADADDWWTLIPFALAETATSGG